MKLVGNSEQMRESTAKMDVISTRRLKEVSQTVNCISRSLLTERFRTQGAFKHIDTMRYINVRQRAHGWPALSTARNQIQNKNGIAQKIRYRLKATISKLYV